MEAGEIGFGSMVIAGLVHIAPLIFAALIAGGLWARIDAQFRHRPLDTGFIFTAFLLVSLLPPGASLLHVVYGMSFAMILAYTVFGGEGKTFLSPALVGAAAVQISFPAYLVGNPLWSGLSGYAGTTAFAVIHEQGMEGLPWFGIDLWTAVIGATQGLIGATSLLAVAIGGVVLVYGGIASWRLILGVVVGVAVTSMICNLFGAGAPGMAWYWHIALGSLALGTVFVATDPASSSSTNSGRWIQGLLTGSLVVLLRVINPSHSDSVIPVLLLMSMLAPLIDHGVAWANISMRAKRHG